MPHSYAKALIQQRFFFLLLLLIPLQIPASPLEKVSVQLQWKHQFEYAGFYAAIEKGFYKEEGLDVSLKEISADIDPLEEVISGNANYGITYSSLVADYLNDKPVVLLANIFKHSALVLIAQKDIVLPSDLAGKTVMGRKVELNNSGITMMLNRFNMSTDNFNIVEPTHSLDDFISKNIDAMTAFITNQPFQLNKQKIKYSILNPTSYGSQFYDVNLFTSRQEIEKYPHRTEAFRRASIKGWQYAMTHTDEVIQIILDKYNSQNKSRDALKYEAEITKSLILPDIYPIGSIDCNVLTEMRDGFIQSGMVSNDSDGNFSGFLLDQHCRPVKSLSLSETEKQYLLKKKTIKLCADPAWLPFEGIKNGKHIGMSADYMEKIAEDISVPFTLVETNTWGQSLTFAEQRKCDILSLAMPTPERQKYMDFTSPYLVIPLVIATTTDKLFIADFEEVLTEKLGIVKGYAFLEILKNKYPDIQLVEVENIEEGLKKVANEEIFGMIDNLSTIGYQIQRNYIGTLKITGRINENWELGIGVRNDDPVLLNILEKAISNIDEKTHQHIFNQWMSITYDRGIDYSLIRNILIVFALAFILFFYRYHLIQKHNKVLETLNEKLTRLSVTDPLTQLYNRLKLDESLINEIARAQRYNLPLGVIMLDLDFFKKINDTHGHQIGDQILKITADILKENIRQPDILGRWGGEEFLIICPNIDLSGAIVLAEHLRALIENHRFPTINNATSCFGVTQLKADDKMNTLIARADEALYKAKDNGRNRVEAIE
jgi:polar amino acid transport system substrate-binding protein